MKKAYMALMALVMMPVMATAAKFVVGDTLWVNKEWQSIKGEEARNEAAYFGVISEIDTTENVATIQFFEPQSQRLVATHHRVASGKGKGGLKGEQFRFYENGNVEAKAVFTLVRKERSKNKVQDRLVSETLFYEDGTMKEELSLSYDTVEGREHRSYARKCYYPDGALQYEEISSNKKLKTVYYKPDGKVDKRPKEKIAPYEEWPEFPGGKDAVIEFLNDNIKYPEIARKNGIEGRVIVQFIVAEDGTIENVEVARSGGDPSLDREAVRVIKKMPKWTPGKKRGKAVRLKYTVPVNFRLH